jgi:hypothetical protein
MLISILLAWLSVAAADCDLAPGPADAKFKALAPAAGVVIFEIRLLGQAPVPTELLQVLADRNLPATVLVSSSWAKRNGDALRDLPKSGHELGLFFSLRRDLRLTSQTIAVPDFGDWVVGLRRARREVRQNTGHRAKSIGIESLPDVGEVAMEALGYKALLPDERNVGDTPRRAQSVTGMAGQARVIGIGPYLDGCGAALPHWSPASLDRATSAVARGDWVRVVLPPDINAAPLLARWLDDVVIPQQWDVVTAIVASRRTRRPVLFPNKPILVDQKAEPTPSVAVKRTVARSTWDAVAHSLVQPTTLPRQLPGELCPTEAFLGMVTLLASDNATTPIALGALRPPMETARTGLGGSNVPLEAEDVRATARELLPGLSGQVPSLVSVGTHTLTAAEFLRVMALVVLNEPAIARGVNDPDPYAPGGGWGESKGL